MPFICLVLAKYLAGSHTGHGCFGGTTSAFT
jgi:hypothetical protein